MPTGPYTQPQADRVSPAQKAQSASVELPPDFRPFTGVNRPLSPQYQKWFDFLVHIPLSAILAVLRPLGFEYTISTNYTYDEEDPGAIISQEVFALTGMHGQSNEDGVTAILLWLALLRKAPADLDYFYLVEAQDWASRISDGSQIFSGDYSLSGFYYPLTGHPVFEVFQRWIVVRDGVEVDEPPDTWSDFNPHMNSGKLVVRIVKHALPV